MKLLSASVLLVLATSLTAIADPGGVRYVDRSSRLPADTNPPDTDSLDVDLADVDRDGDRDLFIAEGTADTTGRTSRLLINNGRGRFADETALRLPPLVANSTEIAFADVDKDGDLDGLLANVGPEFLLLNDGSGHFRNASATHLPAPLGFLEDISTEGLFVDVDGDRDLDLLIANEVPFPVPGVNGAQNRLWINDGRGHFADETASRLPARQDQSQGHVAVDIDRDGDHDLVVVNIGQDFVLVNDGSGHFTDETASRFPATSDSTRNAAAGDVNGDRCPDLFMGNSRNQQSRLYLNNCRGVFTDVTASALPAATHTTTDVDLVDIDRDGDLDAYLANAGDFLVGHGFLGEQNVLLLNDGRGRYVDATARYFPAVIDASTNAEFGDVDGDRDLDLVIGNSGATAGAEVLYIRSNLHN
jgi:hypothetical protein